MTTYFTDLWLLIRFFFVLHKKMRASERKYKWNNSWWYADNEVLQKSLVDHVLKGDVRDVAIIAAMVWHHESKEN